MRPTMSIFYRVVALAAVSLTSSFASGQEEPRSHDRDRESVLLSTYEVGDLVVHVPDYTLPADGAAAAPQVRGGGGGGMFGGMGGGMPGMEGAYGGAGMGMPAASSQQQQVTIDSLRNAIVSVVAPESWAMTQAGGQGRIEVVGTALVVAQTGEVHEAIKTLLDELRQGSATRPTVAIDARWLLLDSDDLDQLVVKSEEGQRRLDRKVLDELTRQPTSLRGATKCFSGQAVYLISGTRRNVVSSYIPVVGSVDPPQAGAMYAAQSDPSVMFVQFGGRGGEGGEMGAPLGGGRVGYQPVIEKPNFGVTMEIRPTLSVGGKEAVIDLKSTVTFPGNEPQPADPSAFAPATPQVDRLSIQTQELATTLRIPLGEPVLVGGMTYLVPTANDAQQLAAEPASPTGAENRQLYLVIELR